MSFLDLWGSVEGIPRKCLRQPNQIVEKRVLVVVPEPLVKQTCPMMGYAIEVDLEEEEMEKFQKPDSSFREAGGLNRYQDHRQIHVQHQ